MIALSEGNYHALALKSDGSVVAWGSNSSGKATVPVSAQSGVVAVSAGDNHSLALKSDRSVVAWGQTAYGQCDVLGSIQGGALAVAGGYSHSIALVAAWVSFAPSTVWAGDASVGTVHLPSPAPKEGATVLLSSDIPSVHVPASVKVPKWSTTATFPLTTDLSFSNRTAMVSVSYDGQRTSAILKLKARSLVASFNLPGFVVGSTQKPKLTLTLEGASASDATFALSAPAGLGLPATITLPAGQASKTIQFYPDATFPVGSATVTVSYGVKQVASTTINANPVQAAVVLDPATVVAGGTLGGEFG